MRRRVFVDTNALFPISLCDLFLRMAEVGLHEVLWTEALLTELAEKLEEKGVRSRLSIDRICDGIRTTFPEGEIARTAYAAAVAAGASFLITNDTKGFPAAALRRRGVTVKRPDAYLLETLDAFPRELLDVVRQMAADKVRPPMSVENVMKALRVAQSGCTLDQVGGDIRERLAEPEP